MSFLTAITKVLAQQSEALTEVAEYETNSKMLVLSLQLGRLRTIGEQSELLHTCYREAIEALKALDEQGTPHFLLMNEALPQAGMSMEQVSEAVGKFSGFIGVTEQLDQIDIASVDGVALGAIPTDHPVYEILKNYKDYLSWQSFLEKVTELMDWAEAHQNGEKLSAEEVKEVKDEKVSHLTAAQKVLALHYLMRWSGIELGQRQGAKQQRFIAALTGISVGTVKEKFPTLSVTGKPYYLDNLKAIVPLFESVGALKQVEKIQADIAFEQEEREQ